MNKKENKKMGNLKCIAVILALTAMVAGGAARMGAVAGDYIVAVQSSRRKNAAVWMMFAEPITVS